jgi:hypothetical protein
MGREYEQAVGFFVAPSFRLGRHVERILRREQMTELDHSSD